MMSPNYPNDSGPDKNCRIKYVAPKYSQVLVNFRDMDLQEDDTGTCFKDYVKLVEATNTNHGIIGETC